MKIYRTSTTTPNGHYGYKYFKSKQEAKKHLANSRREEREYYGADYKEFCDFDLDEFDFDISAIGMINALNRLGNHKDNG